MKPHPARLTILVLAFAATAAFAQTGDVLRPKVALVLSGGSAWGLAHIGVIKVMEEIGVPVDMVVGTSMGSIVGGLYAMGYNAADLESIMTGTDWTDLFAEDFTRGSGSVTEQKDRARYAASLDFDKRGFTPGTGLLDGNKILRFIDSLSLSVPSPVDYDALPRRYRAVATDVSTGERVVLSKGSLADTMRSSMSLPGIFSPYGLDGRYFVDGCMSDNLPIELAREMGADIVIAVDLFDGTDFDPDTENLTPVDALLRSFDILVRTNVTRQLDLADLVIPVDVRGFLPSDFAKGPEIGLRGEQTARQYADRIARIRDIARERAGSAARTPERPEMPQVDRIVIRGVTGKDLGTAQKIFAPLSGTTPSVSDFQKTFRKLDGTGRYRSVRVRRDFSAGDRTRVVDLAGRAPEKNEVRLHFLYEATFSSALTGNFDFVPALQYRTVLRSAGMDIAVQPFEGIEWRAGWRGDLIDSEAITGFEADTAVGSASLLHAGFSIQRLDSPVFPASGMTASADFLLSSTGMGSERAFRTLEAAGSAFFAPAMPFSVGVIWRAGTDFSGGTDGTETAPPFYKPDLADRRLFPGPLRIDERIGSHVAGAGIELKHNLSWRSRGIQFPVFFLANASVGAVLQNPRTIDWSDELLHWNATAGLALRVSDAFGIAFRCGVQQNTAKAFTPFIAFDLGALGY